MLEHGANNDEADGGSDDGDFDMVTSGRATSSKTACSMTPPHGGIC